MVDSQASGTSKRRKGQRVDTLHFDSQEFTDLWKIVIEKSKKFIFIIGKRAKNSRLQKE